MKDLAPDLVRQRLLVEGYWTVDLDAGSVRRLLLDLAARLELRAYGEPVVFAPATGTGREENAGWDAFVPLVDSGISGYFWARRQFFSVLLYSCRLFDAASAVAFIRERLRADGEVAWSEF